MRRTVFALNRRQRSTASRSERDGMSQETLDISKLLPVFACYKTCGATGRLHSSRAADAMDVIFRAIGQIEIDHVADVRDIDPSCGNIRRDQHTK